LISSKLATPILSVRDLRKYFILSQGVVKAVDGVDFDVNEGETLALVGESGSGKTTTAHVIMGFYTASGGSVKYKSEEIGYIPIEKRSLKLRKEIQIVFQDPATSLNPKKSVKDILEIAIKTHFPNSSRLERLKLMLDLINFVGLSEDLLFKKPSELGGGEKQLVALARALAPDPQLIILDEPTSALDVSAQARVLRALSKVQRERKNTYLLITHDLSVVRNLATKVAIMYLGKIYEYATTEEFFSNPLHPYTQMLLSSVPTLTEEEEKILPRKIPSSGEIPSPMNPPSGCRFYPRCPFAKEICKIREPPPIVIKDKEDSFHIVRCWLYIDTQKIP